MDCGHHVTGYDNIRVTVSMYRELYLELMLAMVVKVRKFWVEFSRLNVVLLSVCFQISLFVRKSVLELV